MFNPTKISGQHQQEMMKKQFNISTSKQSELRRIAAKSSDKSLRFWGQKLGKSTMTPSQLRETLKKLAEEAKLSSIKHVDSRVKAFVVAKKRSEQDKIAKEQQEKLKQRSIAYRKWQRSKEVRGSIREEMERIEKERLSQDSKDNINQEREDKNSNKPVISASALSTEKTEDKENTAPQTPSPPLDLPLD